MARTPQFDRDIALNNAMLLFWKQGYHATSMKDIEYALDMRPGSIYAAFGNKESLFNEALRTYGEQLIEQYTGFLFEGSDTIEGFRKVLITMVDECGKQKPSMACMVVKSLLELHTLDDADASTAISYIDRFENIFKEAFLLAKERGQLGPDEDPERLAVLYQATLIGVTTYAHRGLEKTALNQLVEDALERVLPRN